MTATDASEGCLPLDRATRHHQAHPRPAASIRSNRPVHLIERNVHVQPHRNAQRGRYFASGVFTDIDAVSIVVFVVGLLGFLPARAAASHEVRCVWAGSRSVDVTVTDGGGGFNYRSDAHAQESGRSATCEAEVSRPRK